MATPAHLHLHNNNNNNNNNHHNHGGPTLDDAAFHLQRKTSLELQTLEILYSDDKNPTQSRVEDYASALGLTYEQVKRWYIERRRRDKQNADQMRRGNGSAGSTGKAKSKMKNKKHLSLRELTEDRSSSKRPDLMQNKLYPTDYRCSRIPRRDGPPLDSAFDSRPSAAFQGGNGMTDIRYCDGADLNEQMAPKRRKLSEAATIESERHSQTKAPIKHGKGKGLMSVWQLTSNGAIPDIAGASKRRKDLPCKEKPLAKRHGMGKGLMMARQLGGPDPDSIRDRRSQRRKPVARRKSVNKVQQKRKPPVRRRRVESSSNKNQNVHREICELALDIGNCEASFELASYRELADDEELELRALHAASNSVTCSSHFDSGGSHGCSLCKGLLPKFPPDFVKMRKPLPLRPWCTSLKLEKKLFKVFHFLYTYAVTLDLCPFTLDEFAKAFVVKESLLLGKLHICLLQLLLSDVDVELSSDIFIHSNKSGMFLNLLHTAKNQRSLVSFWKKTLNPLTWTEILRQVMIAAGFGLRDGIHKKECIHKGVEHMVKFGLRPGTLKGALFDILFEKGNKGIKVTELAKSSQVVDLNLGKSDSKLEDSICSILAGDITLFEKISLSTYRLRLSSIMEKDEDFQSDTEGCGSIDDEYGDGSVSINSSECDSVNDNSRLDTLHHSREDHRSNICTEIDESHPGESWLLGLMDGDYSDLSIEEKLDAFLALVDLSSAGSSIRMKELSTNLAGGIPNIYLHGSGGKIKRSTVGQPYSPNPSWVDVGETRGGRKGYQSHDFSAVDSSVVLSMSHDKEKSLDKERVSKGTGVRDHLHTMQSIYLGSDRRYNRYWLFLGPCNADDPGHARVYVECSEDGQWLVIESEEALCVIVGTLNNQGRREAGLLASLQKRMAFLLKEMSSKVIMEANSCQSTHSDVSEIDRVNEDSPSPISDIDSNLSMVESSLRAVISSGPIVEVDKVEVQKQTYASLQAYDLWIWNCFYSGLHAVKCGKQSYSESLTRCASCHDLYWRDERHCRACHTTFELDFDLEEKYAIHVAMCRGSEDADKCPMHRVLPSQLQAVKAAAHAIELVMPKDALIGAWQKSAHKLWVRRLRRTSSLQELLQVLSDFVGAINVEWLLQCNIELGCDSFIQDAVSYLQKMPQTLSAVALLLVQLDILIGPHLYEVAEVEITKGKR